MSKKAIAHYIEHLSKDKVLAPLVKAIEHPEREKRDNICLRLCTSVIGQQLSTHVAKVIFNRFLELYGDNEPSPQQILDSSFEDLRAIGLSNAKATYIQNIARFMIEHNLSDEDIHQMDDAEIVDTLTQIKGVGRWTVEMLLMFSLGREDVFSIDDLVIRQQMVRLYKLDETDKKELRKRMLKISSKWAPYRTYACMYLWRHKDTPGAKLK